MSILLGPSRVLSVRMVTPWSGTWVADCVLDPDVPPVLLGKLPLVIATNVPLIGTPDPSASGTFGPCASVRLVGGLGWSKPVIALPYHSDVGVLTTEVFATTAVEVGEAATDVIPERLGIDYMRSEGPASRVLDGRDWYVTPVGVTIIGPRIPTPMNPLTTEVMSWDPLRHVAVLATTDVITPGTILVDPKFIGALMVREVDQTWDDAGATAICRCTDVTADAPPSGGGSKLVGAIRALIDQRVQREYLAPQQYRVIEQAADGRLILQAISKSVPEAALISIWPGVPGVTAKLLLGSEVLLEFAGGDPTSPVVRGFGPTVPLEVAIDAIQVKIGEGAAPAVLYTGTAAWATLVEAALSALGHPIPTLFALTPLTASTKLSSD